MDGWRRATNYSWLLLAVLTVALLGRTTAVAGGDLVCNGSVTVCGQDGDEWSIESETSRRILATQQYIAYASLSRSACNNPPGKAYTQGSGCLSNAVNPSSRGCQSVYQCRQ